MVVATLNFVEMVSEATLVKQWEDGSFILTASCSYRVFKYPSLYFSFFYFFLGVFFPLKNSRTLRFIDHELMLNKATKSKTVSEVSI